MELLPQIRKVNAQALGRRGAILSPHVWRHVRVDVAEHGVAFFSSELSFHGVSKEGGVEVRGVRRRANGFGFRHSGSWFMGMGCFEDYTLDMMKGRDFAVSARGGSEKILIGHRDSEQLRSGCDETGVGLLFSARIITHIKIANNKQSKVEGCLISSTVNTTVGNSPGSRCVVRVWVHDWWFS